MLTKRMSMVLSLGAALMAGCTGPEAGNEAAVTVGVRRMRLVTAATAVRVVKHSNCGTWGVPNGEKK